MPALQARDYDGSKPTDSSFAHRMDSSSPQSPRGWLLSSAALLVVALALAGIVTAVWVNTASKHLDPHQPPVVAKPGPDKVAAAAVTFVAPVAKAEPVDKTAAEPAAPSARPQPEAPPAPPPPWQAALSATGELLGYTDVAFATFEQAFDRPDRDDLTPWFEKTDAAGLRISKIPTQYGKSGTIEGIGRLLSPWPADGVLRLALDNFNRLKMHFFHGLEGVTLVYYEERGNRWAAYATTREEGKPTPKTWAITATDDDRFRRTEPRLGGSIELRYRDGEVMLSRGDVVLLTAPLPGPPSDVYFEGRATIHGIALARTKDAPTELAPPLLGAAGMLKRERPGDEAWTATMPETAKPVQQADGSLRFAGNNLPDRAACFLPLPTSGIQEVILELADVTPGAIVYLGRADDESREDFLFCRDRRTGQLAVQHRGDSATWVRDYDPPSESPAPLIQPHCWLRLLYGCGNLRWWISSDGIHWAQTQPATDNVEPGLASIGLQLAADQPGVGITVKRILIRPLTGLSSLADAKLAEQSPAITTAELLDDWFSDALKQKPAEVEPTAWLRACCVRTLGRGAPRKLAYALLEILLDDMAARGLSLAEQLAALDDAMLMALDLRDRQAMQVGLWSRYAKLGIRAADQEGVPAWSSVRRHYHAAAAVTPLQNPADLDRVIRWELVTSAYRREQHETLDALTRLRFFGQVRRSEEGGLADWVQWHSRREASEQAVGQWASRVKESWRHPLVEELSKDTYNALTELQAVLESQAWEDAARLVTSLDPTTIEGIAPYVNDRSLLTSIPVAVHLALEDYPQVRQSLGERFEALAKLRIAQATSAGDAAAIELASVQFAGTAAVAEAHRWLGDEALAQGRFERAIRQYERARAASLVSEAEIAPRLRLAGAMLGRDMAAPVTEAVQFGDVTISAADFEALVAEMRTRESGGGLSSVATQQTTVPPPSGFETHVRSRLDGPLGDRPQEETGRRTSQLHVPWADRQLATAVEGDVMYVANRFQVAAYRLTTGERLWQSQPPPGRMQRAQDFALIAMRPLILGDRIFVRLLYSPSPLLVCLEKSSGKLLWASEHRDREFLISDPLMIEGQLVALAITIEHDQQARLRFFSFEPRTGEVLRQRELVHLRNTWGSRGCCEVAETEEGLVVVLCGVTLALNPAGEIGWIRTHVVLPADDDPRWVLQPYQRPIVQGRRLYVAQPGVRTVDCLDAATGRQHWSAVLPEVIGTVGLAGNVLVVRTEGDIRGLDVKTGATRWRYPADDLYSFQQVSDDRLLIARRQRLPGQAGRWQPRLEWLNPADGQHLAATPLPELADEDPRLGPLVSYQDRLFTFFGRGQHDPAREVVELVPRGEAEARPATPDAWHATAMRP